MYLRRRVARIFFFLSMAAAVMAIAAIACTQAPNRRNDMTTDDDAREQYAGKSDTELRTTLTPEQYSVVCENGTEPPFDNAYWDNHEAGIYVDVVSGEPLFASTDKFNSGTGWPSFTRPIDPDAIIYHTDTTLGFTRTEVRGRAADSHLGHVFADGPTPTGQRFCVNSASLRFIPVDQLAAGGYGKYLPLFGLAAAAAPPEIAIVAGGCFWGVEAYFQRIDGVLDTEAGYTGGTTENPTYEEVCSHTTGHAEAVRITFDPAVLSYRDLLRHFFRIHDPTTPDRQGHDVGNQYRSAIFYLNDDQAATARELIGSIADEYPAPIVTEVVPAGRFWPAEAYHQDYLEKNPGGYCHVDLGCAADPLPE